MGAERDAPKSRGTTARGQIWESRLPKREAPINMADLQCGPFRARLAS